MYFALLDAKTELTEIELNCFDIRKYFVKYFPLLSVSFSCFAIEDFIAVDIFKEEKYLKILMLRLILPKSIKFMLYFWSYE